MREMPHRAAALVVALWLVTATGAACAATYTVAMEGTRFDPPDLTVKAGDTVIWVNKDPFPHTATASGKSFDSGNIAPGKAWKYRARKKGDFPYVCTLHPGMQGRLSVE